MGKPRIIAFKSFANQFGYREVTGHWPDLSDKDDVTKVGAEAFAFVNFARFAVPLRIGLALSTTSWVQANNVDRFMKWKGDLVRWGSLTQQLSWLRKRVQDKWKRGSRRVLWHRRPPERQKIEIETVLRERERRYSLLRRRRERKDTRERS
jgi:hypothetical protein